MRVNTDEDRRLTIAAAHVDPAADNGATARARSYPLADLLSKEELLDETCNHCGVNPAADIRGVAGEVFSGLLEYIFADNSSSWVHVAKRCCSVAVSEAPDLLHGSYSREDLQRELREVVSSGSYSCSYPLADLLEASGEGEGECSFCEVDLEKDIFELRTAVFRGLIQFLFSCAGKGKWKQVATRAFCLCFAYAPHLLPRLDKNGEERLPRLEDMAPYFGEKEKGARQR